MFEFRLPDLGEGIHEGEVLKWHVQPGDVVVEDAPLVDIETDKAAVTIPSPKGGPVMSVAGEVGDIVETGQVICVIDAGGEAEVSVEATSRAAEETPVGLPESEEDAVAAPVARTSMQPNSSIVGRPVPAAPATRRLARELGLNINAIEGTGPGGRVMPADVKIVADGGAPASLAKSAIVPTTKPVPSEDVAAVTRMAANASSTIPFLDLEPLPDFSKQGKVEIEPLRSIRRKVARKMVTSMVLVPHVAHMDDADVTELENFRLRMKEKRKGLPGGKLTLLSFVIRAITAGLRAAPAFNASLEPFKEEIIYKKYYNIGFAADTGHGLVVPVIKGTDVKSINEIAAEIEEKAGLAREGKLPIDDMQGGTFTITNVGPLGGTALIPTINYPEVAILGMGKVQEKPVVRDGEIVIRKILPLTLAFDHRVADGADAARFVNELVRNLSDPNLLLLDT